MNDKTEKIQNESARNELEYTRQQIEQIQDERNIMQKQALLLMEQAMWQARAIAHLSETELVKKKIELTKLELELEEKRRINNSLPPAEESK